MKAAYVLLGSAIETPSTMRLYWYISTGSGPILRLHIPSSPLVKGIGSLTSITVSMAPDNLTDFASGARRRNKTVWSSNTSGELRFALKGMSPSVSFCGLWDKLTLDCCPQANCAKATNESVAIRCLCFML